MASPVLQKIEELSREKESIQNREGTHHASSEDHRRLQEIEHNLQVLWDLRRRELSGENVDLDEDYLDSYDRY